MLDTIFWDNELIQRYSLDSLSSYPNPAQFQPCSNDQPLQKALELSQQSLNPLSLQINMPAQPLNQQADLAGCYLQALQTEASLIAQCCDRRQHIEQLHLGLGSLELFTAAQLHNLIQHLEQQFTLLSDDSGDYSITLNPQSADWSSMGVLRQLGFNHVRMLVNTPLHTTELEHIQALADASQTLQYNTFSIALEYGRPQQSALSFGKALQQLIALQPNQILLSPYPTPQQEAPAGVSNAGFKMRLFKQCLELLTGAGYRYIGPGLFCLADDELVIAQEEGTLTYALQGYSAHGISEQIALGVGACGQIADLHYQNHANLSAYLQALKNSQLPLARCYQQSIQERINNEAIAQLRCRFCIDAEQIASAKGLSLRELFAEVWPQLCNMAADGLLILNEQRLSLLPAGRLLLTRCCELLQNSHRPAQNYTANGIP